MSYSGLDRVSRAQPAFVEELIGKLPMVPPACMEEIGRLNP